MPRTTIDNRARKARIRAREIRQLRNHLAKVEHITPQQIAALRKVQKAANGSNPLSTADIPDWRALREMGVIREKDGALLLTALGREVLNEEDGQ